MHTNHSKTGPVLHAKGTVLQNVEEAHRKGIKEIAITDHGPGHFIYGVGIDMIETMRREIAEAVDLYPDMTVHLAVEANFKDTPNGLDVTPEQFKLYDFVNAGYHYGVTRSHMAWNYMADHGVIGSKSVEVLRYKNTELAVRAIESNKIKIITHPGDKGPFDMREICKACEKAGTLLEINARHKHLTAEEIALAGEYRVGFIIGSDAHRPERIGNYVATVQRAMEAGLDLGRIVNLEEVKGD